MSRDFESNLGVVLSFLPFIHLTVHVLFDPSINQSTLLCLALSTKELETVWPARSQNNGLGWDITAYP